MARPEKIKTPLGQRLTAVRKALGYEVRPPFAELLGMPVETLGGYERGIREPDSAFMAMYHRRFGVNVSWLVSGDGDPFGTAVSFDLFGLREAIAIVEDWLDANDLVLSPSNKAEAVAQIYQLISEDIQEGRRTPDKAKAHQFLRLVVNR